MIHTYTSYSSNTALLVLVLENFNSDQPNSVSDRQYSMLLSTGLMFVAGNPAKFVAWLNTTVIVSPGLYLSNTQAERIMCLKRYAIEML